MRFLTRAWHAGDGPDAESEAVLAAYRSHRATVLPQLPPTVRWFAETVDIHDGLLRATVLDHSSAILRVRLTCGDLQQGYFDVELTYLGVRFDKLDTAVLQVIAGERRAEALYLEEDVVEPGWYVHRWLWWPFRRELDIEFSDLTFSRIPRADRDFDAEPTPYVEIGAPAD